MTTKTPKKIAGTAVHEWLNEYTWPFSERREFSATELADAVEGLIVAAIEADRAQRGAEATARLASIAADLNDDGSRTR